MTFLPFDKLGIGFECELAMVAERPRFTGTGGGGISEADVDGRGRRETAAEEIEDSPPWAASNEKVAAS